MRSPGQSYFDYISPRCELGLEDDKQIFLHNTPAHDDTQHKITSGYKSLGGSGDIAWTRSGHADTQINLVIL